MQRITELDGWRGISILLVIAGHLIGFYYFDVFRSMPHIIELGDMMSRLGVHIFFCISGYVITRLLTEKELSQGHIPFIWFYLRRAFKILPVLIAYLFFLILLSNAGYIQFNTNSAIKSSLFICNTLLWSDCHFFVAHTWTLGVEEQFYLAYPFILFFTRGNIRVVILGLLLIIFIFISLLKVYFHFGTWIDNGVAFACITSGTLLALKENVLRLKCAKIKNTNLITALILILLMLTPHHQWTIAAYKIFSPLLISGILFISMSRSQSEKSLINSKILQSIGTISYSLYVWQQLFLGRDFLYLKDFWLLNSIPGLVIATLCSYWIIEKPMTRLGRRISASYNVTRKEPYNQ